MADGVWSEHSFYEKRSRRRKTGKTGGKNGKKKKRQMKIVATTSFPAVDRLNAGTPHARAKKGWLSLKLYDLKKSVWITEMNKNI